MPAAAVHTAGAEPAVVSRWPVSPESEEPPS
jgi:hypothetical protein